MGKKDRKGLLATVRTYPTAVFFMLGNEFCERFSFYGMRAVLILYLITEHHFSERLNSHFLCFLIKSAVIELKITLPLPLQSGIALLPFIRSLCLCFTVVRLYRS